MEVVASEKAADQPGTGPLLDVRSCEGCDDPNAAHLRSDLQLRLGFRRPGLRLRPAGEVRASCRTSWSTHVSRVRNATLGPWSLPASGSPGSLESPSTAISQAPKAARRFMSPSRRCRTVGSLKLLG